MAEATPTQKTPKTKKKNELSAGAQKIKTLLEGMDVLFTMEVSYSQCKDKNVLRFDFQIIVNGRVAMIEYDGKQHFEETPVFKIDAVKLAKSKQRDIIKNRFCRDKSISLLRIAYTEDDHIQKWVTDFINSLKTTQKPLYVFQSPLLYPNPFADDEGWGCLIS